MTVQQKWLAWAMGLCSSLALFVIQHFPDIKIFFAALVVWLLFLAAGEWIAHKGHPHHQRALPVLVVTALSFVGLMSLVEWRFLFWLFIALGGLTMYVLFRTMMIEGTLIHIGKKSFRRFMMVLWVFDAYALVTTFFALNIFFQNKVPFWMLTILAGVLFAYLSYMIWSMYFSFSWKRNWLWISITALVMIELVWVVHLLPFGYLAAGFFVTWVWYVLQLLIRFHFGARGVVWKKQLWFLGSSLVLYILILLFFVRWV